MNKTVSGFMKGMGTGVAVGIAAGVAGAMLYEGNKKVLRKKANKAIKAVGGFVDDVQSVLR